MVVLSLFPIANAFLAIASLCNTPIMPLQTDSIVTIFCQAAGQRLFEINSTRTESDARKSLLEEKQANASTQLQLPIETVPVARKELVKAQKRSSLKHIHTCHSWTPRSTASMLCSIRRHLLCAPHACTHVNSRNDVHQACGTAPSP